MGDGQADRARGDAAADAAFDAVAAVDARTSDTWRPEDAGPPEGWWDPRWPLRQRIDVADLGCTMSVQHFPLLLRLTPGQAASGAMAHAGRDLRFIAADGAVLPHEVDRWDAGGGPAVWVKLPEVHPGTGGVTIWLYAGNPTAEDAQDPVTLWSPIYDAVAHLDLAVTVTWPHRFPIVNHGASATAGHVGGSYTFSGEGQYLDLGAQRPFLQGVRGATLSVWIYPFRGTSVEEYASILSISVEGNSGDSRAAVGMDSYGRLFLAARAQTGEDHSMAYGPEGGVEPLRWQHVVGVARYDLNVVEVYLDGQRIGSGGASFTVSSTLDSPAAQASIGADDDGVGERFEGAVDEARVANRALPACWIAAEARAATGAGLASFGEAQRR